MLQQQCYTTYFAEALEGMHAAVAACHMDMGHRGMAWGVHSAAAVVACHIEVRLDMQTVAWVPAVEGTQGCTCLEPALVAWVGQSFLAADMRELADWHWTAGVLRLNP